MIKRKQLLLTVLDSKQSKKKFNNRIPNSHKPIVCKQHNQVTMHRHKWRKQGKEQLYVSNNFRSAKLSTEKFAIQAKASYSNKVSR